jgi:hypothetical protein
MTTTVLTSPAPKAPFRLGGFETESTAWIARVEHVIVPAVAAFLSLGAIGLMLGA